MTFSAPAASALLDWPFEPPPHPPEGGAAPELEVVSTPTPGGREASDTLPLRAGVSVVVGFGATLALGVAFLELTAEDRTLSLAAALGSVVVQYLAMFVMCAAVSRRWGSGSLRQDLGLQFRRRDLLHGVVGWLAGMGMIGVMGTALRYLGVPTTTNNPLTNSTDARVVSVPQWVAIGLVGVVMIVVAPLFEELLFRGVLLRSLRSRLPVAAALGVQALAFGLFHFDPRRGVGNIGLLVVLSGIGLMLGMIARRSEGRLSGSILAHGLHNSLAFAVGVAVLL